jgi:galactonate dehydratase
MKITDIKTLVVNAQLRNWVFVKVETDVPWRFDVVQTRLKAEKSYWLPLDEPGLGVEINEAEARKHPFEQEILEQMVFHPDGSVAEW